MRDKQLFGKLYRNTTKSRQLKAFMAYLREEMGIDASEAGVMDYTGGPEGNTHVIRGTRKDKKGTQRTHPFLCIGCKIVERKFGSEWEVIKAMIVPSIGYAFCKNGSGRGVFIRFAHDQADRFDAGDELHTFVFRPVPESQRWGVRVGKKLGSQYKAKNPQGSQPNRGGSGERRALDLDVEKHMSRGDVGSAARAAAVLLSGGGKKQAKSIPEPDLVVPKSAKKRRRKPATASRNGFVEAYARLF